MNDEKKISKPSEKSDKTTITEKERYKGKLDKLKIKNVRLQAKPDPKKQDTSPSQIKSLTNTTKHNKM